MLKTDRRARKYFQAYESMVLEAASPYRSRHRYDDQGSFFSSEHYMKKNFSSRYASKWKELNDEYKWFTTEKYATVRPIGLHMGKTEIKQHVVYYLTEEGRAAAVSIVNDVETKAQLEKRLGRKINRRNGGTLRSRDKNNNKAKRPKRQLPRAITVNLEALQSGKAVLESIRDGSWIDCDNIQVNKLIEETLSKRNTRLTEREWALKAIVEIAFIRFVVGEDGYLAQQYEQATSGRWYATEGITRYTKLVRKLALFGKHEYDIENAGLAILLQKARHNRSYPAVEDYMLNKQARRKEWAKAAGVAPELIKKGIQARIFGAGSDGDAMMAMFDGAEELSRFNRVCADLLKEVVRLNGVLYEVGEGSIGRGFTVNDLGKAMKVDGATKGSVLAHWIQGAEAHILTEVADSEPWGQDLEVIIHDAFVFSKAVDVEGLKRYLKKKTGYSVQLERD